MAVTINEWQKAAHARNVEKGFYDYQMDLELVSKFLNDVYRSAEFPGLGGDPVTVRVDLSVYWALGRMVTDYKRAMIERKLLLVVGELCEAHEELRHGHPPTETYFNAGSDKPEGFGVEMADAAIRQFDLCEAAGVDLEARIIEKHAYNGTRPYKHGKRF